MIDLLPNGPFDWALTAGLLFASVYVIWSERKLVFVAIVLIMWCNWAFTQVGLDLDLPLIVATSNCVSGVTLALTLNPRAMRIAWCFVPRMMLLALGVGGIIPIGAAQELSAYIFILQLIALTGGTHHGLFALIGKKSASLGNIQHNNIGRLSPDASAFVYPSAIYFQGRRNFLGIPTGNL